MALGNGIGFRFDEGCTLDELFAYSYGSFVLELTEQEEIGLPLGVTTEEGSFIWREESIPLQELQEAYEGKLEPHLSLQHCPGPEGDSYAVCPW